MRVLLLVVFVLTSSASTATVFNPQPYQAAQAQNPGNRDAERLWELAIAAKGGREKLYQVKSLALSDARAASVDFMVLPNRFFRWGDTRPSKLGLVIEMFNFERDFGYTIFASHQPGIDEHDHLSEGLRSRFLEPQLYYLLETKWFKPELLAGYKDKLNGELVDVVEVNVKGYGLGYRSRVFLDEKTHLPVRVGWMSNLRDNDMFDWVDLGGYQENTGIQVPTKIRGKYTGTWSKVIIEINPEYNPQVFEREPNPDAGAFQWRKVR